MIKTRLLTQIQYNEEGKTLKVKKKKRKKQTDTIMKPDPVAYKLMIKTVVHKKQQKQQKRVPANGM